ncbi:TPA: hypothetical protein N0F65_007109 [Lagenidium giganteum]|uniref:C2 domain-containing protein n=1 Tax=Lagenidium giganteum TaxID=4803 RepID=A0AAV2YPM1_9STRA|nr:TPA: hypothetical protein N0F65_007109 [Lagenidium giganteum]
MPSPIGSRLAPPRNKHARSVSAPPPPACYGNSLDAMTASVVDISLRIESACDLRPAQKGLKSNPLVEVALVLADESTHRLHRIMAGTELRVQRKRKGSRALAQTTISPIGSPTSTDNATDPAAFLPSAELNTTKPLKSNVVRHSLNPIWNFDVDFGEVSTDKIVGVNVVVRHIAKLGVVKKDLGQVTLSIRELMDLKTSPPYQQSYQLQPTEAMLLKLQEECVGGVERSRDFGKITIKFNNYGVSQSTPARYEYMTGTSLSDSALSTSSNGSNVSVGSIGSSGSIAHEDDFNKSMKNVLTKDPRNELKALAACHTNKPKPGEVWYAISASWIEAWARHMADNASKTTHPGEIRNMSLVSDDLVNGTFQLKQNLLIKHDFRLVNQATWDYYSGEYGGGPAVIVQVPTNIQSVSTWMKDLKLHRYGRVGTTYE